VSQFDYLPPPEAAAPKPHEAATFLLCYFVHFVHLVDRMSDYAKALPELVDFYASVRQVSDTPFDVNLNARSRSASVTQSRCLRAYAFLINLVYRLKLPIDDALPRV
jgi:hypothetical protein